jgi:hypothetical protein
VYLTSTGRGWAEVNGLLKMPGHIDGWRGTVYCEVIGRPEQREQLLGHWGDCGLGVGPFVFFGDRALLRQIRAALGDDPPPRARNSPGGGGYVTAGSVLIIASDISSNPALGGQGDGTAGLGEGGGVSNLGTFLHDALTIIAQNHASDSHDDCFGC